MIEKIDHIGIVVPDLEEAIAAYQRMGLTLLRTEESQEFNVKIAFLPCGEVLIELLQPIGPGMNQDFLDQTGGGIHHICYKVPDINAQFDEMRRQFRVKEEGIKTGAGGSRVFFLDPVSMGNVETEFAQLPQT